MKIVMSPVMEVNRDLDTVLRWSADGHFSAILVF